MGYLSASSRFCEGYGVLPAEKSENDVNLSACVDFGFALVNIALKREPNILLTILEEVMEEEASRTEKEAISI
jgi:hypothetical protein